MGTPNSTVVAVDWDHPDAVALRAALTAELADRYADHAADPAVAAALAVEGPIAYTGLAIRDGHAVGHLALRANGDDLELKRMYVAPAARGTGTATALLAAAERAAGELGAARIVLQTGDRQPEAVRLYERAGYTPIPVFAPYDALSFSRCFAKPVTTPAPVGTTPHPC